MRTSLSAFNNEVALMTKVDLHILVMVNIVANGDPSFANVCVIIHGFATTDLEMPSLSSVQIE